MTIDNITSTPRLTFSFTVGNLGKKRADWDHYIAVDEPLSERTARYKDAHDTAIRLTANEPQQNTTTETSPKPHVAPTAVQHLSAPTQHMPTTPQGHKLSWIQCKLLWHSCVCNQQAVSSLITLLRTIHCNNSSHSMLLSSPLPLVGTINNSRLNQIQRPTTSSQDKWITDGISTTRHKASVPALGTSDGEQLHAWRVLQESGGSLHQHTPLMMMDRSKNLRRLLQAENPRGSNRIPGRNTPTPPTRLLLRMTLSPLGVV